MDFYNVFMYAVYIIVGVGAVIWAVKKVFSWSENNHSPITECRATVIKKGQQVTGNPRQPRWSVARYENTGVHICTFRLENGRKMRFKLPLGDYVQLKEGEEVMLRLQGTRYIGLAEGKGKQI